MTRATAPRRRLAVRRWGPDLGTCPLRRTVHRHESYKLVWLARGSVAYFNDFRGYRLEPGTLAFISPGQVFTLEVTDADGEMTVAAFDEDLLARYGAAAELFDPLALPLLPVAEPLRSRVASAMEALLELTDEEGGDEVMHAYLHVLLQEAGRAARPLRRTEPAGASERLARAFVREMERRYRERRPVHSYADQLGVSADHLAKVVREATGRPPKRLLQERLLLEAKRLLAHGDRTAEAIADELSFPDASQFGRWFRRLEGVPPGRFREAFRVPPVP